jgi:hypothetical protein
MKLTLEFMMKLRCITCDALSRPSYLCAAFSPHIVDIELLPRGLHNKPSDLRDFLQNRISESEKQDYDAIILVYGLCGQATAGLYADRIPFAIPRAHDCITLFLGRRERYSDQFEKYPGTYWYSHDYIERDDGTAGALSLGSSNLTNDLEDEYKTFISKYGQDNADYLMTIMGAWQKHYQRAVYIDMNIGDEQKIKDKAMAQATERGWAFEEISGDLALLRKLFSGAWMEREDPDILIVHPGQSIRMTSDQNVLGCVFGKSSPY